MKPSGAWEAAAGTRPGPERSASRCRAEPLGFGPPAARALSVPASPPHTRFSHPHLPPRGCCPLQALSVHGPPIPLDESPLLFCCNAARSRAWRSSGPPRIATGAAAGPHQAARPFQTLNLIEAKPARPPAGRQALPDAATGQAGRSSTSGTPDCLVSAPPPVPPHPTTRSRTPHRRPLQARQNRNVGRGGGVAGEGRGGEGRGGALAGERGKGAATRAQTHSMWPLRHQWVTAVHIRRKRVDIQNRRTARRSGTSLALFTL
jgi:hypothetical protein